MKILILSDHFPPYVFGGAERSTFDLAQAFQKNGHEVFVITTCQEKKLCREENLAGLKIFRIYASYHPRWRAYLSLYNPQTVGKVRQLLREIKPDIVHANNIHCYLSYFCLKLAKKYSKRVFLTARDTMSFYYGKLATKKYLEKLDCRTCWRDHLKQARKKYNPFRNIIIRHYLKYVDKVFAVSYALKEALNQNGIFNAEVIHTGINVENWKISPEPVEEFKEKYNLQNKKVIFFGARLSESKGGGKILRAMKYIAEQVPETILLVAGKKQSYAQEMSVLAQKLGIKNHIIFTGWLSGDQLKSAYYSADVVVVPSVYLEPLGRTNIEAMACQKPVVGTCYGGVPETVQDGVTGYIVNPFNIELMAGKIIDLLKNPQKAKQFGEAGYQRVKEEFNLEKKANQYLTYFEHEHVYDNEHIVNK